MSLVTASRLEKPFGADLLFRQVSFALAPGTRVGLVGPNGAGKTTLLKIILGQEEPNGGELTKAKDLRLGYLPQVPPALDDRPLWDFLLEVFADLFVCEKRLAALAAQMVAPDYPPAVLAKYEQAQHEFEAKGGYSYERRIHTLLSGLGFQPEQHRQPLA